MNLFDKNIFKYFDIQTFYSCPALRWTNELKYQIHPTEHLSKKLRQVAKLIFKSSRIYLCLIMYNICTHNWQFTH